MSTESTNPACPICRDAGRILHFYSRGPTSPPGNQWVGCPECPAGKVYDAAIREETAPRCPMCAKRGNAPCGMPTPMGCPMDLALEQSYRTIQEGMA